MKNYLILLLLILTNCSSPKIAENLGQGSQYQTFDTTKIKQSSNSVVKGKFSSQEANQIASTYQSARSGYKAEQDRKEYEESQTCKWCNKRTQTFRYDPLGFKSLSLGYFCSQKCLGEYELYLKTQ